MGSTPADLKRDPDFDHQPDELAELRALLARPANRRVADAAEAARRSRPPRRRNQPGPRQSIALSTRRDHDLQRAFYPIVEQALQISVTRNPAFLATSLAPIIGEAVRKAVANAFRGMVENINRHAGAKPVLREHEVALRGDAHRKVVWRDRVAPQPALQACSRFF